MDFTIEKLPDSFTVESTPPYAGAPEHVARAAARFAEKQGPWTAGESFQHGISLGVREEVAGAAAATGQFLKNLFSSGNPELTPGEAYDAATMAERERRRAYKEKNPILGTAAEIGGGIFTGGPAVKAITTAPTLLRGAVESAKSGAIIGGAAGAGEAEGGLAERVTGAATGAATGGVLGGAAPVAGRALAIPGDIAKRVLRSIFTDEQTAGRIAATEAAGMSPTLAAQGSEFAGRAAQNLGVVPIVGKTIRGAGERTKREAAGAIEDVAAGYGTAGKSREGAEAVQEGLEAFRGAPVDREVRVPQHRIDELKREKAGEPGSTFRVKSKALYQELEDVVGGDRRFNYGNTRAALDRVTRPYADAPNVTGGGSGIQRLRAELEGVNDLSFDTLQKIRERVGAKIRPGSEFADANERDLKHLYSALTRDMEQAARSVGGTAPRRFQRAEGFYRAGRDRLNKLEKLTGSETPEGVAKAVWQAAQSGVGKGNIALLRNVRRTVPDEEWGDFAAGIIREMGQPTAAAAKGASRADDLSLTSFMTKWKTMENEAKDVLFGTGQQRQALDRLANAFQDAPRLQSFANFSNSANAAQTGMWGIAALGNLPLAAKALAGSAGVAKFLTSPAAARWLAGTRQAKTPQQIAAHVARLQAVGRASGWTAEELADVEEAVRPYMEAGATPGQMPENRRRS